MFANFCYFFIINAFINLWPIALNTWPYCCQQLVMYRDVVIIVVGLQQQPALWSSSVNLSLNSVIQTTSTHWGTLTCRSLVTWTQHCRWSVHDTVLTSTMIAVCRLSQQCSPAAVLTDVVIMSCLMTSFHYRYTTSPHRMMLMTTTTMMMIAAAMTVVTFQVSFHFHNFTFTYFSCVHWYNSALHPSGVGLTYLRTYLLSYILTYLLT